MKSVKVSTERGSRFTVGVVLLSLIFFLVSACAAQQTVTTYTEDVSPNRPRFEVSADSVRKHAVTDPTEMSTRTMHATKNVNEKVDVVMDSIDRFNLTRRFVDGYTVQIYAGTKKDIAMNSKSKLSQDAPDLTATIEYNQPKFRVIVGRYFTKLEAQKDLIRLKRIFPNTILVPDKIQVR